MCLKIHFFRLLLTWLNWEANSQHLSRRHQREKTVVIVHEEVAEWSWCTFYGRRLRFEFPGRWNTENSWSVCRGATDTGNTTTIAWREGSVLMKETTPSGNTDDRTRGIKECRAKRKLEFQGMVEDWSPLKKRAVCIINVWGYTKILPQNLVFAIRGTKQFPKSFKTSASLRLSLLWNSSQFELLYYTTGSS